MSPVQCGVTLRICSHALLPSLAATLAIVAVTGMFLAARALAALTSFGLLNAFDNRHLALSQALPAGIPLGLLLGSRADRVNVANKSWIGNPRRSATELRSNGLEAY